MKRAHWSAGLLALWIAACQAVGEDYGAQQLELPANWQAREQAGISDADAQLEGWWRQLGDPLLDELIERSARESLDLRESLARLREARALRGDVASERFPTVDARAAVERRGESDNTPFGSFVPDSTVYSAGFDAAWEIDVWGRVRRSVEAADADLAATIEDVRDVAVTVAGEIALNYIELRAFQRRVEIARNNVSLQEQTLDLVRGRFEAGLVGERDVAQARTNVESTRSAVPALEIGVAAAANRLAVILGQPPGTLFPQLGVAAPIPVPPLSVAVGVPADLLRRRADVRSAERQVAAEHARIGVAEGDLLPRLSLFGDLGVASDDLSSLFEEDSVVFGIGPSIRWNIFDAGRLRYRVAAQEARAEQAMLRWERAVLVALEEAENAMSAFVREQTRRASLIEAASQARLAVQLTRAQYQEGLSDFQNVLTSERALALLEDDVASSDASIATNYVALTKALGGGWEHSKELASAMAR